MNGRRTTALLLVIILIGSSVRLSALTADIRFHPDEALFATFARRAALNGDWMLPGALDKPPLALYSMALAMLPFMTHPAEGLPDLTTRAGEIAARLPGLIASVLLIPLTYALAHRLYRRRTTALLASLLVAASPLAAAFGASAFTDGLMLLFGTLALYAGAAGRWGWAGAALALGFASKQQALYLIPLVVGMGWLLHELTPIRLIRISLAFGTGVLLLLAWDALRGQPTGFMTLAAANNDPARLIRSDEVLPRIARWLELVATTFTPMTALFIPAAFASVIGRLQRASALNTLIDLLLTVYILAYLLLHWLVAFNIYDRYLILLLPPLALLTARGLMWLYEMLIGKLPAAELRFVGVLFVTAMLVTAYDAAQGRLGIGSNSARMAGIDWLAEDLNRLPLGTILYDYWLGWELDYYLGQWTDKRRVYYPTPRTLAEDARRQLDPAPRYFIVPRWVSARPWLEALTDAGFAPELDWRVEEFEVYRLLPPHQP